MIRAFFLLPVTVTYVVVLFSRPRVMWGTQEMLWPVSPRAMTGSATPRVQALATPKKDFQAGTVHDNR